MKNIIPNNPELDRAALILRAMSPDLVADIVRLVNLQGGSTVQNLFNPNSAASAATANSFLGILSKEYITDEDFPAVWAGLSTVRIK